MLSHSFFVLFIEKGPTEFFSSRTATHKVFFRNQKYESTVSHILFYWRDSKVREMGAMKSKAKLSKAEIKKLEDNTKFTKAEILRWYKGFIQVRHDLFKDKIAIFLSIPSQRQAHLVPVIIAVMRINLSTHLWLSFVTCYWNVQDCPSGELSKNDFTDIYAGFFPKGNAGEFAQMVFQVHIK